MTTADDYINSVLAQLPHGAPLAPQIELELRATIAERLGHGQTLDLILRQLGDPVKLAESYLAAEPLVAAPAGDRILAKIVDVLVMLLIVAPLAWFVSYMVPGPPQLMAIVVFSAVCGSFLLGIATAFVEYASGQTPGKRLVGLRVVTESGRRIGVGQAVVRQLPILFSVIWVDALFALFTERRQRAFELLSQTRVVVAPRATKPKETDMRVAGVMICAALLWPSALNAQTVDPSGHWEGTIQLPSGELEIEADFIREPGGAVSGTMNQPAEQITGLPLGIVTMDGRSIRFHTRSDQPFIGVISADGRSISGGYNIQVYSIPFSLTRTGAARIAEPVKSAPIGSGLEGRWTAAITAGGATKHVMLTLANQPDGTAAGRLIHVDDGGLQIPLAISQDRSTVTLRATVLPASFGGTLSADGAELSGAWTQGATVLPVTFRRAEAPADPASPAAAHLP
jgi:uncharacterized RDD family membrane protein YckC